MFKILDVLSKLMLKEGEGRKEGWTKGKKEGQKEGRKEDWEESRKGGWKENQKRKVSQ
jgi:hypothetical protein